jgi:hypothetical protein
MTTQRSASGRRVKLGVQALEARDVPAGPTTFDLTFTGAQVTANSAILQQTASVSSDQFRTFVALQNSGTEEGYNTDARPFQLDQTGDLTVTHALLLADIPIVNIGGVDYRQFFLDVNELSAGSQVSKTQVLLEELRIYLAEAPDLTGYNSHTETLSGLGAAWDLDGSGNVSVKLDASLNPTGVGDAFVYIPSTYFGSSTYVYLYSKFGGKVKSDGGAESWGVMPPPPPPPGSISGYVYFDADNDGVREPDGSPPDFLIPELGLNTVTLHLTGTNDLGQSVDMFFTTGSDPNLPAGYYEFTGLRPGTYTVTKMNDPDGYSDGMNTPGQPGNGLVQESNSDPQVADMIYNISLGGGTGLTEYNFGELELPQPG